MKKILSLLLVLITVVSCFACSGGGGDDENYVSRPKRIEIMYYSAGYGKEWIDNNAKYYMDNVDKDTYVKITHTILSGEEGEKIRSGLSNADLTLIPYAMFRSSDSLCELTDLLDRNVYGETKLLKEKISNDYLTFYNEGGKYYQLPLGDSNGYQMAYNKTTLDSIFKGEEYILPRTTEEMFEFADILKSNDTYFTVTSLYDSTSYFKYGMMTWMAQMLGFDNRENILDGKWLNGAGEYELQENAEFLGDPIIKQAVESTWNVSERLFNKSNGYVHSDSNSMNFQQAQASLCGLGFGNNKRKVATMYNGPWLELEMKYLLDEAESKIGKQELRVFNLPLMSDIITRTPSITDEATLRKVVDVVDGVEGATLPLGVTAEDYEIVNEARHMVGSILLSGIRIPKTAKNPEGAKDFVLYLASDIAQEIALQATGGLSVLPYGYYESQELETSPFMSDYIKLSEDRYMIDWGNLNKVFYCTCGMDLFYNGQNGIWDANLFSQFYKEKGLKTGTDFYNLMYQYYNDPLKWPSMLQSYRAAISGLNT